MKFQASPRPDGGRSGAAVASRYRKMKGRISRARHGDRRRPASALHVFGALDVEDMVCFLLNLSTFTNSFTY
jgi:hypothetical protein